MEKSYARDSGKESTLDYTDWRTSDGTRLYPDDDLSLERIHRAREHIEMIRASAEVTAELPYQLEDL